MPFDLEFNHYLRGTIGQSRDLAVTAAAEATLALVGPRRYRIQNIGADPCNIRMFPIPTTSYNIAATDQVLVPDDYAIVWVGVVNNYDPAKNGPSVVHAQCFGGALATTLRITDISRP